MRKDVSFFVSYAHRNKQLAEDFLDRFVDVVKPAKNHRYVLWHDTAILVGNDWEREITEALRSCDFGLLLISPAFLGSVFVTERELPAFVDANKKPSIPVMLQPVDFRYHDVKGLDTKQIFRLDYPGFHEPRAYGECKPKRRETFVLELFRAIEKRLA